MAPVPAAPALSKKLETPQSAAIGCSSAEGSVRNLRYMSPKRIEVKYVDENEHLSPRGVALEMESWIASTRADISQLKEFYLDRLANREFAELGPKTIALGPKVALLCKERADTATPRTSNVRRFVTCPSDVSQPHANGAYARLGICSKDHLATAHVQDVEDLDITCNKCFNLIKLSEAPNCNGQPASCTVRANGGATSPFELLDMKLRDLRAALQVRLLDASSKVDVMRHLSQLRYHIDTALDWAPRHPNLGPLSEHTMQQVRQLTVTSRVLAPGVHVFSKRAEDLIVQKERACRSFVRDESIAGAPELDLTTKSNVSDSTSDPGGSTSDPGSAQVSDSTIDPVIVCDSNSDPGSAQVSDSTSDPGSDQRRSTHAEQYSIAMDMSNAPSVAEQLSQTRIVEDERRRWFYSQYFECKLACPDRALARKIFISDLYAKVKVEGIPTEEWEQWIRRQFQIPRAC